MGRRRRPDALAALGATRGAADESTYRRTFARVSADALDAALGAWLWTRAARAGGRMVIAVDGKTVRGAKGRDGKAPHLVAALAHGIGAVLGQVAADAKSNEIPAVRELLKAFADLTGAVLTMDALHAQHDTAQAVLARHADYVMTVKANMPTLYSQLKKLPWKDVPAFSHVTKDHGRRARRTVKALCGPSVSPLLSVLSPPSAPTRWPASWRYRRSWDASASLLTGLVAAIGTLSVSSPLIAGCWPSPQ